MTNRQPRFTPDFLRDAKQLRKRYPHLDDDLHPLVDQLRNGETPGDQVTGTGFAVFKERLPNRDANRGLSGGYRVIYYLRMVDQIVLLTIYSKSDHADIPAKTLRKIIRAYEASDPSKR